jgi:hypothetical protein
MLKRSKKKLHQTPIRPQTHVTGDVGQTAASLLFKRWGWTADIVASDYGEDLDCAIFVDHRRTSFQFRCQVKSTANVESNVRRLKSGDFSVSIATSLCKLWLFSYFPVFILVYDEKTEDIYWADATIQIQKAIDRLSQKSLSLHVSTRRSLRGSRDEIIGLVERFYSHLLNLSSRGLTCDVYPVVMPGYRAVAFFELMKVPISKTLERIKTERTSRDRNWMPAWATVIKSLDQHFLAGWKFTTLEGDIQDFSRLLKTVLSEVKIPSEEAEWLSFICSPVQFEASDNTQTAKSIWNKELTQWWNYSKIRSGLVDDMDYAFATPSGFLRQIARRATSWETYHHVDPKRDLAVQMFVKVAITPGERWDQTTVRRNIEGQFVPWVCVNNEIRHLQALLHPLELEFREVGDAATPQGYKAGIICTQFFEPGLGIFTPAHRWEEFDHGAVKWKLESTGALNQIPGREGSVEITKKIVTMFGQLMAEVPDSFMISERDYNSGLPLDHSNREVFVQRFRQVETLNRKKIEKLFAQGEKKTIDLLGSPERVEWSFDLFEVFPGEKIAEL